MQVQTSLANLNNLMNECVGDVFLTLRNMITFKSVFKKLTDAFSGPIVIMEVVLYISLNCSAIIC